MEEVDINQMMETLKVKFNFVPLLKDPTKLKHENSNTFFLLDFDYENQVTSINLYVKPTETYNGNAIPFPLYISTNKVHYLDKKPDEIGQEILESLSQFSLSKEIVEARMDFLESININIPKGDE